MKIQKYIQWTLISELKILQKFVIQIFTATKTFELILFEIKKSQMRNLPKATIYNQQYGNDKSGQSRRIHNRKCPVKNIHWNIRQEHICFNSLIVHVLPNTDWVKFGIIFVKKINITFPMNWTFMPRLITTVCIIQNNFHLMFDDELESTCTYNIELNLIIKLYWGK